ncbi:hypothetical protein Tco_1335419 [Tanacetum coccineum]
MIAIKDSKKAADDDTSKKEEVLQEPDSTKVEVKQEGYEENIRKRFGKPHDYYRVFRADGSSRWIKTFSEMVIRFDRMDLEELYKLVMQRFETTTPEGIDLILWGSLRIMFEANADDDLWKN